MAEDSPSTVASALGHLQDSVLELVERSAAQAFAVGYAAGLVQADQEPGNRLAVTQAYEDWRQSRR